MHINCFENNFPLIGSHFQFSYFVRKIFQMCPRGQGEGGGQPNVDKLGQRGGGGVENHHFFADVFYGWPLREPPLVSFIDL